uniref:SET domain-containing protein n=1 Tax=Pseudo-nitzschia delicatissima TaxID=44447 RepID=A0A7S0ULC9_9STRA|mmetsp:Transcript_87/g.209  ORF Transcript_87/g.209 Transcript_87/m.209 type:complete len:663 (+) Transcript_87:178-2166(+)|eukprot:CAMPEP_0197281068 /NCGR_PEP_ID=MMETSP1432-20130617/22218_1 /TAXON_ID=44447 /ORGANISM="Pseudo-nitzschia delicatissima, Strain UNC1205" /LENGTH=662 /DNA_ID=CAMNT_0042747819 /DNA_START=75 /DNA_END=2063 /DNA_ORIENTATION=+
MRIQTLLATSIAATTIHNAKADRQISPDLKKEETNDSCGLYMATSSTSMAGAHKWGVYAGKDYEDKVPVGFGDLAIHFFDLLGNQIWYNRETGEIADDLDENYLANIVDWFEQYVWVPQSSGGQFEIKNQDMGAKIVTVVPGTGVIGGFNPKLTNTDWNHSSAYHRDAWNEFPEEAHPGRGAYTNYYNLELTSTEVIPAGREIFMEFGVNWSDEDKEKETLTKKDYDRVDQTVEKMIQFFEKHDGKLDASAKQKVYDFLKEDVMEAAAGSDKVGKIRRILPSDPSQLQQLLDDGGALSATAPGSVRPLEWLEENGLCMDNIKPGPSTIPYAGRGAFANRAIPKDGLVAPVPLIIIADETVLDMHRLTSLEIEDEDMTMMVRDSNEKIGIQLFMNYCWGHPKSTMLFFPAGAVVGYINHAPSKDKVNAKMIWSEHAENRLDVLEEKIDGFLDVGSLVVEIVATREIKEGEEIFIDYGDEWQDAWDKHVEQWNKDKEDSWPMRALDFNQYHKEYPFRTVDDEPYPDNVMVKCFLMVKKPSGEGVERDAEGRKIRIWSEADSGKSNLISNNLFDCTILSHRDTANEDYYDVLWDSGKSETIVKDVPHKAIVLLDAPEEGDQHIWNSFRHYVSMGDIFPEAWKDLGVDEEELMTPEQALYNEGGEL